MRPVRSRPPGTAWRSGVNRMASDWFFQSDSRAFATRIKDATMLAHSSASYKELASIHNFSVVDDRYRSLFPQNGPLGGQNGLVERMDRLTQEIKARLSL